jgi:hypothetical protein
MKIRDVITPHAPGIHVPSPRDDRVHPTFTPVMPGVA